MDGSIPLNGMLAAQRSLELVAQHFAAPNLKTDFATELVAVDQANTAVRQIIVLH